MILAHYLLRIQFCECHCAHPAENSVGLGGSSASLSGHPRNVRLAGVYDAKPDGMMDAKSMTAARS